MLARHRRHKAWTARMCTSVRTVSRTDARMYHTYAVVAYSPYISNIGHDTAWYEPSNGL